MYYRQLFKFKTWSNCLPVRFALVNVAGHIVYPTTLIAVQESLVIQEAIQNKKYFCRISSILSTNTIDHSIPFLWNDNSQHVDPSSWVALHHFDTENEMVRARSVTIMRNDEEK